jgi:hypothetical protein
VLNVAAFPPGFECGKLLGIDSWSIELTWATKLGPTSNASTEARPTIALNASNIRIERRFEMTILLAFIPISF